MALPLARRASVAALAAAGAALVAVIGFGDQEAGTVRAAFASAPGVVEGQEIRVAGRKVGEVASSDYEDGLAVVELRIDDDSVWPLRRGTTARFRYGTTISSTARYIELMPGRGSGPAIPDGGLLTRSDTVSAVEFDEVFDMFDRPTRSSLKGFVENGSAALRGRGPDLAHALEDAPGGLNSAAELMRELGADPDALRTLVAAGSRTAGAVASRDAELRSLLANAAETFDELALHADPIRESLERLPSALRTIRTTLDRLDTTLVGLDALATDAAPGSRRFLRLAPTARKATLALDEVAPLATSALTTTTSAAPRVEELLRTGGPFMRLAGDVFAELAPVVGCVRPWGPELMSFPATWAGMGKNYDAQDHYGRILIQTLPYPNGTQQSSAELVRSNPGVFYAFPLPPGQAVGQPFLQPQCGAGPETLDAGQDPETVK